MRSIRSDCVVVTVAYRGSIKVTPGAEPLGDVVVLMKAMKGLGTDEQAIIDLLTSRSNEQRLSMISEYKTNYHKDLIKELKSELSGNLEKAVVAMMMTPAEYDAFELYTAIEGAGTDEACLIEILSSRSNAQIKEINQIYQREYKETLEAAITGDTSGSFRAFLLSLAQGNRDESETVDMHKAKQDAVALHNAGEGQVEIAERTFSDILCSRSKAHLKAVFQEYLSMYGIEIEKSINKKMTGCLKTGMLAVVQCTKKPAVYFAERLYYSMKGLGTNDKTLVRIMVSRSEVDMLDICQKFGKKYGKTLYSFINGDTSGNYGKLLLKLCGGNA